MRRTRGRGGRGRDRASGASSTQLGDVLAQRRPGATVKVAVVTTGGKKKKKKEEEETLPFTLGRVRRLNGAAEHVPNTMGARL